jgi:hypothetical protein
MNSFRAKAFTLLAGLCAFLLPTTGNAVAQSCATMASNAGTGYIGQWDWYSTGGWVLNQDSSGHIYGSMVTFLGSPTCPENEHYNASGQYLGNGQFSITSSYTGTNAGCAGTLTTTGTVTAPGCNNASGTWNNDRGLSGTFQWVNACQIPNGESVPVFQTWGTVPPDTFPVAFFDQQPLPTTYNWGGRTVTETFPTNGNDSCWFQGSLIGKGGINHPSLTYNLPSNKGYTDKLGLGTQNANYYRQHGRTPCGTTLYQTMVMDCPNPQGNQYYSNGTLFLGIGQRTVTDIRNNVGKSEPWGTPAPPLRIVDWLFNLFF